MTPPTGAALVERLSKVATLALDQWMHSIGTESPDVTRMRAPQWKACIEDRETARRAFLSTEGQR